MRLLSGKSTKKESVLTMEDGTEIKIEFAVRALSGIDTSKVFQKVGTVDPVARMEGSSWALLNILESLTIDGEEFDKDGMRQIALLFDPEDEVSRIVMMNLLVLISNAVCLQDDEVKK